MRYTEKRKGGLAVGIIVLLLGASIISSTTVAIEQIKPKNDPPREPNWNIEYAGESPTQYCHAYGVETQGQYTYVGSRSDWNHGMCPDFFGALDIYDTTNSQPTRIGGGTFDMTETFDLTVEGNYAFIAEINSCGWGDVTPGTYINAIDISNPAHPNTENRLSITQYGMQQFRIFANRGYLYVFRPGVFDIYTIPIPNYVDWYVGRLEVPFTSAYDLVIKGNYAYLLGITLETLKDSGPQWRPLLEIIDISAPEAPRVINDIYCQESHSIAIKGSASSDILNRDNFIYLTTETGLEIIDLTDPLNPSEGHNYSMTNPSVAVKVSGNDAYVSSGYFGITLLDISLPNNPIPAGHYTTNVNATAIDLGRNTIYLADEISGFLMLRHIPEIMTTLPKPQGPTQGEVGTEYSFIPIFNFPNQRFSAIYINWSWGDYRFSGWRGPYHSMDTITATHTWSQPGVYPVRYKIRDPAGHESRWSLPLLITIR